MFASVSSVTRLWASTPVHEVSAQLWEILQQARPTVGVRWDFVTVAMLVEVALAAASDQCLFASILHFHNLCVRVTEALQVTWPSSLAPIA